MSRKVTSLRSIWLRRFLTVNNPHPWSSFFDYHVSLVFKDQDVLQLLARDTIPAYLVRKLPPFYASLVRAWIDVKGMKAGQLWVIPRPTLDPLPVEEFSARSAYIWFII